MASENDMRYKLGYQEVILINGFDKVIEEEYQRFNERARMMKKVGGYFYCTFDKNLYYNEFAMNNGGSAIFKKILIDYNSYENFLRFKSAANRQDWKTIYEHTKFLINDGYYGAWFSFQFLPKDSKYLKREFAIISAENPYMSYADSCPSYIASSLRKINEENNEKMYNLLKKCNYEFYKTVGELTHHSEKCFIIYNISKEKALELGAMFHQESIVFNDTESISIIECASKKAVLNFKFRHLYRKLHCSK